MEVLSTMSSEDAEKEVQEWEEFLGRQVHEDEVNYLGEFNF